MSLLILRLVNKPQVLKVGDYPLTTLKGWVRVFFPVQQPLFVDLGAVDGTTWVAAFCNSLKKAFLVVFIAFI